MIKNSSSLRIAGVLPVVGIRDISPLEDAQTLEIFRSHLRENFMFGMGFYEFLVFMSGDGTSLQGVQKTPPIQLAYMAWAKYRRAKEMQKLYDSLKK